MNVRVSQSRALALTAGLLTACAAQVEPELAVSSQAIVNGSETQVEPAVVQVQLHIEGGVRYNCTGSLIHPSLVLTAAHCLPEYFWIEDQPRKLETVEVYFGYDDRQPPAADGGLPMRIAAAGWCRHPEAPYRDTLPGVPGAEIAPCSFPHAPDTTPVRPLDGLEPYAGRFDTAIIRLAEPAPASVGLLELSYELPDDLSQARIVGFGAIAVVGEDELIGHGIKREGTPHVVGIFDGEDDPFERYRDMLQVESPSTGSAAGCKEDSGGPLFMKMRDGNSKIVATTSHGDRYCGLRVQYAPLTYSEAFILDHLRLH